MTSDQQSSAEQVGDLTSVATTYKEVPDELQNLQSFVTQGKLAGFSAPDGLLCIDDDCAKRRQDMPDKYKCKVCTCAGKNGKDSPCKVKINVEASHSGLAVVAFDDLQNVAAAFAGVDATMVSFTLEDADKIGMSVWLEDSAKAAALAAKVIEDIEKGPKSTLSISIAKAIEDQNKDGIKVSSVETSASGASESKYENDKGPVQSDGRSCSEAKSKFKCDAPAVKDVAGTCAETVCKISDFGEATANCCKLPPPEYGWRVKINATWTGTNCKKVLSLIPILKSRPEFKEMAPLVEDDALSCIDFGGCVDNV